MLRSIESSGVERGGFSLDRPPIQCPVDEALLFGKNGEDGELTVEGGLGHGPTVARASWDKRSRGGIELDMPVLDEGVSDDLEHPAEPIGIRGDVGRPGSG